MNESSVDNVVKAAILALGLAGAIGTKAAAQAPAPSDSLCTSADGPSAAGWRRVIGQGISFCVPPDWGTSRAGRRSSGANTLYGGGGQITWRRGRPDRNAVQSSIATMPGGFVRQAPSTPCMQGRRLSENIGGHPADLFDNTCQSTYYTGVTWQQPEFYFRGESQDPATSELQIQVYRTVQFDDDERPAAARPARAGSCGLPAPDTLPYTQSAVLRGSNADVRNSFLAALRDRGYRLRPGGDSSVLSTETKSDWPEIAGADHWRTHPHPGVSLSIGLQVRGDSVVVEMAALAHCGSPAAQPSHSHARVEDAAEAAAVVDLGSAFLHHWRSTASASAAAAESGDAPPRLVSCPPLAHSDSLRQAGAHGTVIFSFIVDTTGHVTESSIAVRESPHPDLTRIARDALTACRFRPARMEGEAVPARVQMPFNFRP